MSKLRVGTTLLQPVAQADHLAVQLARGCVLFDIATLTLPSIVFSVAASTQDSQAVKPMQALAKPR